MGREFSRAGLLAALIAGSAAACSVAAEDHSFGAQFANLSACPPEPTTPDAQGHPRNANGDIRYCWPGEAYCHCDADNDCYAMEGYVPCSSSSLGSSGTSSTACALPSGQTRLASNGTTVCAPHDERVHISSDCCDWYAGVCYPPSSTDLTCGASTGGSALDAGTGGSTDAGTDAGTNNASTESGDCALPSGQTRLASNGTTVCAPHDERVHISSDCCDWYAGVCYPPQPTDLACGGSGGSSAPGAESDAGSAQPPPSAPPPPSDALPAFDAATEQHVRDLVARGRARGNRHAVVAKIGDSITESASFLSDCGFGWYNTGDYPELDSTIRYFSMVDLDGRNSLNRASVCATAGWTAADAIAGGSSSPLARELDEIRPLWAIIMYGTNDVDRSDPSTFGANMRSIVELVEARGVVPVLSTIPERMDTERAASRVPYYNQEIRALAAERHLPLIDYNVALSRVPGLGLASDGIHPNTYRTNGDSFACYFTRAALDYGYNVRNLTALQMLARLRSY